MDHLCHLCIVFVMLSRLFIAALWSAAGKGLTSWHLFVMFNCVCVTFPCGILGQVWYLIIPIPFFAVFLTYCPYAFNYYLISRVQLSSLLGVYHPR